MAEFVDGSAAQGEMMGEMMGETMGETKSQTMHETLRSRPCAKRTGNPDRHSALEQCLARWSGRDGLASVRIGPMGRQATDHSGHAGEAALGLVEALLLHLLESQRLRQTDFDEIYDSIIGAHREAEQETGDDKHAVIRDLLEHVRAGHNGVRLASTMPHPALRVSGRGGPADGDSRD